MQTAIQSIEVRDLDGQTVDLMKTYKNQVLLVIIYNNDCLGCTGRAIPLAYDFQQKYPSIQVLGIHTNFPNREADKEAIKSIFTSGEVPFPIYIDEHHKIYDTFKAEGTPHWLLISEKGVLYRSVFGSQDNTQNRLYYALESVMDLQE
ncbi:TlpA family protein disulfide reductase [Oceanihabitans sediminis]|uniref:TlpA family protein disulfide reductase n=1 Tax=Oceanihabitans sediminis TaxID=1812012 RepID=UPI003A9363DE